MTHPLVSVLQVAVPLWIDELRQRADLGEYISAAAPAISQLIAERGDRLLYRSKREGETAEVFNRFAEGIALLSFVPGGVTIFGLHFESPSTVAPANRSMVGVVVEPPKHSGTRSKPRRKKPKAH